MFFNENPIKAVESQEKFDSVDILQGTYKTGKNLSLENPNDGYNREKRQELRNTLDQS